MTIVSQFEPIIFCILLLFGPQLGILIFLKVRMVSVLPWSEWIPKSSLYLVMPGVWELPADWLSSAPSSLLCPLTWLDLRAKHVPPPRTTLQLEHNWVSTLGLLDLQCVHHQRRQGNNPHISKHNFWGHNQNIRAELRNWVQLIMQT